MEQATLIEQITTATIPALPAFDVATHIREMTEDERKDAEVPIGWMNANAKRLAKALAEPEHEVVENTLHIHKLRKASMDDPILAELGKQATTTWGQMYEMMRRQGRGQEGDLLVDGWANIFYIPDAEGTLWAVSCGWDSGGRCWDVCAFPVTSLNAWSGGYQVVSR